MSLSALRALRVLAAVRHEAGKALAALGVGGEQTLPTIASA